MLNPTFVKELTSLVGPQYIMSELEDRICYSFDATFIDSLPDVVVRPGSRDEVIKIVKLAYQYKVPVVSRGAATGLSGGAVPVKGGIVLELTRLNHIIDIDVVNQRATLEPGVITQDFLNAVNKAGLFYPPDPASSKMSTFGGNISECAGGPKGVKYGVTRDYLLWK